MNGKFLHLSLALASLVLDGVSFALYWPREVDWRYAFTSAILQYFFAVLTLASSVDLLLKRKNPIFLIVVTTIVFSLANGSLFCAIFKGDETTFELPPNDTLFQKTFKLYYSALQNQTPGENGGTKPLSSAVLFIMLVQSYVHYYLNITLFGGAVSYFYNRK